MPHGSLLLLSRTLITALAACSVGCSRGEERPAAASRPTAATPASAGVEVVWGPDSQCANPSVNQFIARAVRCCAEGDYEEYRLLWAYDQEPISRKRFEQLRQAMQRVQVRTVRHLRLRAPDGKLLDEAYPVYLFHATIEMKEEAKKRSDNRLEDRELVLLLRYEECAWGFTPAPEQYKSAILDALASGGTAPSRPSADGG